MTLPVLYKTTSTGKIQTWEIFVGTDASNNGWIVTTYGLKDGKQQRAEEVITEGKNIGKSNETTPLQQAWAEAQAQWEKKIKKGYVQSLEAAEAKEIDTAYIAGGVEPMLAHTYEKQSHKISYPANVQPKLDGHRCIAVIQNGECTLWSRTRKRITGVPHIERRLEDLFKDLGRTIILDGELYNHSYKNRFQELTSYIRQVTPKPGHKAVQFWVYDVVCDGSFSDRLPILEELKVSNVGNDTIVVVPTEEVVDEDEMIAVFGTYMSYGFEGLMIRNKAGRYKHGRSYDLQKVKVQADSEFNIVGVKEGRGKMAGHAIFECVTAEGKGFSVKMKGETALLKAYLHDSNLWKDRDLVVQYQGLTADGIPRFPVGLRIREDI